MCFVKYKVRRAMRSNKRNAFVNGKDTTSQITNENNSNEWEYVNEQDVLFHLSSWGCTENLMKTRSQENLNATSPSIISWTQINLFYLWFICRFRGIACKNADDFTIQRKNWNNNVSYSYKQSTYTWDDNR